MRQSSMNLWVCHGQKVHGYNINMALTTQGITFASVGVLRFYQLT